MSNKRSIIKFLFFLLLVFLFYSPKKIIAQSNYLIPQTKSTTVWATVTGPSGIGYRFSIFGYSSPKALVHLEGLDYHYQTYADNNGYFIFLNQPSGKIPLEPCLTAQDQLGRISKPICIPPLPENYDYNVEIGPIILPPTLSLNKPAVEEAYFIGSNVFLTGQTIPNSEINLAIFTKNKKSLLTLNIIKRVEAFSFPKMETVSDGQGNFSFALPSTSSKIYRLFAQVSYQDFHSPESFILQLQVLPIYLIIVRFFTSIFLILKSRLLEILILSILLILIIYLWRRFTHPLMISKKRALAVRTPHELLKEESAIIHAEKRSI